MEELNQRLKFYGDENDNIIEFLRQCEKKMESIGDNLTHQNKINFVEKYCRNSAAQ